MTVDASAGLADFQALRPRLFGVAYRMLGSATDGSCHDEESRPVGSA